MRRLLQLLSLLTLAMSGVMIAGSFIGAEASASVTAEPSVLQAAWYWQNALEQVNPPAATGPAPATEPSGVPDGDLAVAHTSSDASSSKMSLLAFNLGGADVPGTTINSFTVTLTVDSSPQAANAGTPTIVACLPTRLWAPANGGDYTAEPPSDCSGAAKPKVDGSTYTFDITAFAQDWVNDQNIGVSFVNAPDNTQTPYQVDFTGAKTVKASMSYTLPTKSGSAGGTTSGGGTPSTGGGTTTTSTGSSGTSVPPTVNVPPSTTTASVAPDAGQAPQVAIPQAQPKVQPVAHVAPSSSAPTRGFWIAAAVLALVVLLASLVLGDEVAAGTRSTSRLDRVLRGHTGTGSALSARS